MEYTRQCPASKYLKRSVQPLSGSSLIILVRESPRPDTPLTALQKRLSYIKGYANINRVTYAKFVMPRNHPQTTPISPKSNLSPLSLRVKGHTRAVCLRL